MIQRYDLYTHGDDAWIDEHSLGDYVLYTDYQDKVMGLEADLESAVEVAYRHGATEWVRLNYPKKFAELQARKGGPHA